MPIMRNPFRKNDENARPLLSLPVAEKPPSSSGTVIYPYSTDKGPVEYQLSEISRSGVYLPPSPTDKKSFWGTTSSRSTTSSSLHRCAFDEKEQFNISRESFDSYRRSFDISARSPIIPSVEVRQRTSLDSKTFQPPRSSNSFHRSLQLPQTQEEDRFEDVEIDDPKPQPPKKRGIFARMLDSDDHSDDNARPAPNPDKSAPWHHLTSRKRGQSGQGAELTVVPQSEANPEAERPAEISQAPTNRDMNGASKPVNTQAPEVRVVES